MLSAPVDLGILSLERLHRDIVDNMSRATALLCLLLLASTHATRYQFISPTVPDSFTSKNGPLYSFSLASIPSWSGSTQEWTVRAWIYVTSVTNNDMELLAITLPNVFIYISTVQLILKNNNFNTKAAESLPKLVWFHILMGSDSSQLFGAFTKRNGTKCNIAVSAPSTIDSATVFTGSSNASGFSVSHI